MSAATVPAAGGAPAPRTAAGGATLPLRFARGSAALALVLMGGQAWMGMLEPPVGNRAWYAVWIGLLIIGGLTAAARLPARLRVAASGAVAIVALALSVLAAGVADDLLAPGRWAELAGGIERGVASLPGVRVPYRGLDEWTRVVLALGGTLFAAVALLLAFWPRQGGRVGVPAAAVPLLVALYAVPAIALDVNGELVRGALLALLVLAFLRLERLRVRDARAGIAVAVATALVALAAAPLLDGDQPWWDYETWALSAASSRSTTFEWEHDYGPLDWPRDGREVLRVRAKLDSYWKADALDVFDGARWVRSPLAWGDSEATHRPSDPRVLDRWTQEIRVNVRNMRSRTAIAAGTPLDFDMGSRFISPTGVATIFRPSRPLRRGDTYTAQVYTPRPTQAQMRAAGTDYEGFLRQYMRFQLPLRRDHRFAGATHAIDPAPFGPVRLPGSSDEVHTPVSRADEVMSQSDLARTWQLAQQLRRRSRTPHGFVSRVMTYLGRGFAYTENPAPTAENLEGFLFEAREGYCQQFSGAMALLLRMGGVPARVATGFAPGTFDASSREFVVRDVDAHSWVEVWFPELGWVPFDPTPASAPPRRQADNEDGAAAGIGDVRDLGIGQAASDPRLAGVADVQRAIPWRAIAGGVLGLVAALVLGRLWWRRRRTRGELSALAELERALRRTGRDPGPAATLQALEGRLRTPAAAEYVRALREQRYAPRAGTVTPGQRRALRSELGRGGGVLGRLRAWWALPPRPRLHS